MKQYFNSCCWCNEPVECEFVTLKDKFGSRDKAEGDDKTVARARKSSYGIYITFPSPLRLFSK